MSVGSQQYSVSTTAVLIASAPAGSFTGPVGGVVIANTGAAVTAYLGGSAVTSSSGYALAQNATVTLTLYPGDIVYAITSSSTATLSVLQT